MLNRIGEIVRRAPDCLTPGERWLLLILEDCRGDNGIYPSLETLSGRFGASKRTVQRHLTSLQERGILQVSNRSRLSHEGGFLGATNVYRINYDAFELLATDHDDPADASETAPPADTVHEDEPPTIEESPSATVAVVEPEREDVTTLTNAVADSVERRTGNRPTITKRWRDDARLMMDRDHVTLEDALAALAWAEADDFWRANILSVAKLRSKYTTMSLQAQRRGTAHKGGSAFRTMGTANIDVSDLPDLTFGTEPTTTNRPDGVPF